MGGAGVADGAAAACLAAQPGGHGDDPEGADDERASPSPANRPAALHAQPSVNPAMRRPVRGGRPNQNFTRRITAPGSHRITSMTSRQIAGT